MYGVELHQRICCVIARDVPVRWDPYVNNSGSSLKKDVIQANGFIDKIMFVPSSMADGIYGAKTIGDDECPS